jgi:alpha-galactosidase
MWAINKSPLILAFQTTHAPRSSLEIAMNEEVVALNQDPLGKPARLVRRYTEEEYDVWLGELSNSRMVLGIANWKNQSQPISIKVGNVIGIESAQARDVWAKRDTGTLSGTYNSTLSGHELRLLVLSNIVEFSTTKQSTGYLKASEGKLSGAARTTACQPGQCQPVGTYVGNIGQGQAAASVTFDKVVAGSSGTKTMAVDFINYDVALDSAWDWGSSSRNMTIAVNGGKGKRWAFPISGGNWFDTGRLIIDVSGFKMGNNTVVFTASGQREWAPDLVGFEILE